MTLDFDFESVKLSSTFAAGIMVEKLVTTIPVRKPKSGLEFFRVRDDPEWTFSMYLLDLKEGEEEKYIVTPQLISEVMDTGKLKPVMIYTMMTHTHKVFFLSDIPLPDADGKDNEYNRSRREAYGIAKEKWVKIQANMSLGAYEIFLAKGELPEPVWPDEPKTMKDAFQIAFKNKIIDSIDHLVLKQLRGEL
jgi:hypothetical protein